MLTPDQVKAITGLGELAGWGVLLLVVAIVITLITSEK
jgi:hypothetical protein